MLVERAKEGGVDLRNGVVLQDVAFAEGSLHRDDGRRGLRAPRWSWRRGACPIRPWAPRTWGIAWRAVRP
jgi:hypothetical protein